jgi:hypothetical protein
VYFADFIENRVPEFPGFLLNGCRCHIRLCIPYRTTSGRFELMFSCRAPILLSELL